MQKQVFLTKFQNRRNRRRVVERSYKRDSGLIKRKRVFTPWTDWMAWLVLTDVPSRVKVNIWDPIFNCIWPKKLAMIFFCSGLYSDAKYSINQFQRLSKLFDGNKKHDFSRLWWLQRKQANAKIIEIWSDVEFTKDLFDLGCRTISYRLRLLAFGWSWFLSFISSFQT